MTSCALLISADSRWSSASGLETNLGRLGFRVVTEMEMAIAPESVELALVLVDCRRGKQETDYPDADVFSLPGGCLRFAIVCAEVSTQERAALAGRFHDVLQLPVDECALARSLMAQGYIAISASERRALGVKLDVLTCGDAAMAQRVIRLLIDTNRTTLAALHDACGASLWDSVASAAHRIAGSMRMLDCSGMIALLVRLEAAAREQDAALAERLLELVSESLGYLDTSLENLRDVADNR